MVFAPVAAADRVRLALADSGAGLAARSKPIRTHAHAGKIGNYDSCSFSSRGFGRFRPLAGASPHIGAVGALEAVEERIEADVHVSILDAVLAALRAAHPYEEPGIDLYPLLDIALPPRPL